MNEIKSKTFYIKYDQELSVVNKIMLNNFQPEATKKYALIFGNEVKGVHQKAINLSDGVIEIPQLGSKHSLNISVTAGIVIWDLFQKMN